MILCIHICCLSLNCHCPITGHSIDPLTLLEYWGIWFTAPLRAESLISHMVSLYLHSHPILNLRLHVVSRGNYLNLIYWPYTKRFRVVSFGVNCSEPFKYFGGKYFTLLKLASWIIELEGPNPHVKGENYIFGII